MHMMKGSILAVITWMKKIITEDYSGYAKDDYLKYINEAYAGYQGYVQQLQFYHKRKSNV